MDREDRVRERAHRLWEEEGRPEGRHHQHWQRACNEVDAETRNSPNRSGIPQAAPRDNRQTQQSSGGLVGADDVDVGTPDAMGVDDLGVAGPLNDSHEGRLSTGRSKLVGS